MNWQTCVKGSVIAVGALWYLATKRGLWWGEAKSVFRRTLPPGIHRGRFQNRKGEHPYPPVVISHRGGLRERPHNTLEAFKYSVEECGVDVLEFDLWMSKDGHIVLGHDEDISERCNGTGSITSYTLKELKEFDAGWTFTTDGGKTYPFRGQGYTIGTLEETMEAFPYERFPRLKFIWDLKDQRSELVNKVIDLIVDGGEALQNRLSTGSVHHSIVEAFQKANLPVGLSMSKKELYGLFAKYILPGLAAWTTVDNEFVVSRPVAPFLGIQSNASPDSLIDLAHRSGAVMMVFPLNEPDEIWDFLVRGVDGIMSDCPSVAREVVDAFKSLLASEIAGMPRPVTLESMREYVKYCHEHPGEAH